MKESRPYRKEKEVLRMEEIDARCVRLAKCYGADSYDFPSLISRATLEKAGYPRSFPHLLMSACSCCEYSKPVETLLAPGNLKEPEWCLSPTVCHHVYPVWQEKPLEDLQLISARGRCFRNEDHFIPGQRQLEFEMREIVLAGTRERIEETLLPLQDKISGMASDFGIEAHWELASDAFFLPVARLQAISQQLSGAKWELVVPSRGNLAIASINRHRSHFSTRFDLRRKGGTDVETACVAFGLDRWAALPGTFITL